MKKLSILLIVSFVIALVVSSCNKEACPAYSKADTEQTELNV
ncbi:MAG: hypothetical protein Q7J06_09020 [Bacteroidales bacterium]|nr:hypothetical protein [Bacteroidales bacterium]